MNTPKKTENTVSRRQALKTIAAVTGAATISQLPNKWASPVLTSGVLPAHAQTSPPINNVIISNLQALPIVANNPQGVQTFPVQFSFDYTDSTGALLAGSALSAQFSSTPAGILPSQFNTTSGYELDGNGSAGTLYFTVDFSLEQLKDFPESVTITVQITNTLENVSNQLQATYDDLFPEIDTLFISNLQATVGELEPLGVTEIPIDFSIDYEDSAGALVAGSSLNALFISNPEGVEPTELVTTTEYSLSGDGFSGTLNFTVNFALLSGVPDSLTVSVYLINMNTLSSNTIEIEFTGLFPE